MDHRRRSFLGAATFFAATFFVAVTVANCRWREGRSVWVEIYDAGAVADGSDADEAGDRCVADQGNWITVEELFGLIASGAEDLVVVDVRSADFCGASRIPGASCNPLVGGELTEPIAVSDDAGWLVVYDGNGDSVTSLLDFVPTFCHRRVARLSGGFGAWATQGDYPIEQGE